MVDALAGVLDTSQDRVLVVDDSSPDGTGGLADRLADRLPWVSVLHRERKEGIGPAYVAGFRHALADGAELVLEMDCDFSHDPADVPRLIEAAGRADLVLGSRYTEGGGTENWGFVRRFVSRGGCIYAQVLLGVRVRDLTGGFKCFRRTTLEAIERMRAAVDPSSSETRILCNTYSRNDVQVGSVSMPKRFPIFWIRPITDA